MSPRRQREFTAGRWLLRKLLEREGVVAAGRRVAIGVEGPPVLEGEPGVHLSISHRNGRVLVAAADHRVGVDIEAVQPRDVARMSEQVCADDERQRLARMNERAALSSLHELWVLKEAAYKAGLTKHLPLEFSRVRMIPAELEPVQAISWRWENGWVAACAAAHPDGCDVPAPWGDDICESRWVMNLTAAP
ncbi:MAG: 4'-phosphopantetheinyl transferase superfamily protein [Steroidobacteraceae bacterium]